VNAWTASARRGLLAHGALLAVLCACIVGSTGCAGEPAAGRPWIHDIKFVGLHKVDKKDLAGKISIQKTSWLPWAPRVYLDPFAVPGDRVRIEAYYRARGYYAAKVVKADVVTRKSKNPSVDVIFTVVENEPVKISSYETHGLEPVAKDQKKIERLFQLHPGQVFDHDKYVSDKTLLEGQLELRGYAWPKVTGEADVDRDARSADVDIYAEPGPLAHIGTVTAEGENKTRAIDIVRTADLTTGRLYNQAEIDTARNRVYGVGVYSSVRLTLEHDAKDPSIANVRLKVEEGTFRELRLGGGFDIEAQRNDVHLLAQYTKRNFLGGMRTLTLKLQPAYVVVPAVWNAIQKGPAVQAEATFRQPFLFGIRHLDFHWTVGFDLDVDYAFKYYGPRTSFGIHYGVWRDRLQFDLSYNIQFLEFFDTVAAFSTQNASQAGTLYGYLDPYRVAWFQQNIKLDLRDKPLDTHYGAYLGVQVEEGGIYTGSAFTYEKLLPDGRIYIPAGKRLTIAARVQYGRVFDQGEVGSPITRRLYLGGPDSHRGFNFNRLSYQVPAGCPAVIAAIGKSCSSKYSIQPIPIGGDESFLVQGEFRLHLFKLAGNWVGLVGFIDGGDVSAPHVTGTAKAPALVGALNGIDYSNLHWAAGGGLRYATIIGTIRFDLGVRLNRTSACTGGGAADQVTGQCSAGTPNPDPGMRFAYQISVGEAF
jgi:translocation and assembly module TamA